MLLQLERKEFRKSFPRPKHVELIVELADFRLEKDRRIKLPIYAEAGITDYWILDLNREQLLVHCDPHGETYRDVRTLSGDDIIAPLAIPELAIRAAAFFE